MVLGVPVCVEDDDDKVPLKLDKETRVEMHTVILRKKLSFVY